MQVFGALSPETARSRMRTVPGRARQARGNRRPSASSPAASCCAGDRRRSRSRPGPRGCARANRRRHRRARADPRRYPSGPPGKPREESGLRDFLRRAQDIFEEHATGAPAISRSRGRDGLQSFFAAGDAGAGILHLHAGGAVQQDEHGIRRGGEHPARPPAGQRARHGQDEGEQGQDAAGEEKNLPEPGVAGGGAVGGKRKLVAAQCTVRKRIRFSRWMMTGSAASGSSQRSDGWRNVMRYGAAVCAAFTAASKRWRSCGVQSEICQRQRSSKSAGACPATAAR